MTTNIVCNLKKAHPLIEKREEMKIREFMNDYIVYNAENKRPKIKFNRKLFIKSLLSSLDFRKTHSLFSKKNNDIIFKKKRQKFSDNNLKSEILKGQKKVNSEKKIKRASSYRNIKEEKEKDNLNEIYNIKSNKKFITGNIQLEAEKEKENSTITKNINKLYLSAKNFKKIDQKKYRKFLYSLKDSNNKNQHNILLLSPKRNSESVNNSNLTEKEKSFRSIKSITSIKSIKSAKSIQTNKNMQSFMNENYFKKRENSTNINRNEKQIIENEDNKYTKINKTYFIRKSKRQEYLRFLEKKSLALRANYIMNNIQDSRGGKQELRSLYNPLNV